MTSPLPRTGNPPAECSVWQVVGGVSESRTVRLAAEEPLAIDVRFGPLADRKRVRLATTLRTPGDDGALSVGWLVGEGIVSERRQVVEVRTQTPRDRAARVCVDLHPDTEFDPIPHRRLTAMTSACGLCGKELLDALECDVQLPTGRPVVDSAVLPGLAERAIADQELFRATGAVHAAALFDVRGNLLTLAEDVGRHNAVDKVIGRLWLTGAWNPDESILFVSGRAGYELVQKAARAGVPILLAVGAPTSLSVELAERVGLSLLGFARENRFTIYTGRERIADRQSEL